METPPTTVPNPKSDDEKLPASQSVAATSSSALATIDQMSTRELAASLTSAQLNDLSSDSRVIDCLKKFDFGEVPVGQLAEHVGFNPAELKMLGVFWEPAFNNSWIYMSPTLVCENLRYSSMKDFHTDVLHQLIPDPEDPNKSIPRYILGIDYKEVSESDSIVQAYNLSEEKSSLRKTTHKRGSVQKYVIVSGKAFKKIVMRAGKADAFRDYFLKVEELAILMRDFMNALLRFNAWCEKRRTEQLIAGKDNELNAMRAQTAGLDQRAELIKAVGKNLTPMAPNGWVYIASSQIDAAVNHFKLGSTTDLKSRLDVYTKTFSNPATEVFYCNYWRIYEPKVIENIAKVLLKRYHFKSETRVRQDETYIMNYRLFESIIATLCANHCGATEFVDGRIDRFAADVSEPSTVVPRQLPVAPLCIEMKMTADDKTIEIPVDISNLSDLEKTKIATEIVNAYVRNKTGDRKYDVARDPNEVPSDTADSDKKIQIAWSDLHQFIKDRTARGNKTKVAQSGLKSMFSSVLTGIGSLDYRTRKGQK